MLSYTLTKYLTADYLRENDFLRAYLDLVDEIIFCCNMESLDILSNLSFEDMDDNYFIEYQNLFLDGLSTYDVNKLDKLVLSEWFSLLHVRGELSDIDKLLKFGGSLKNKEKNIFELYHNADVPNQTIDTTKDGLIYLFTENNIELDEDYLINKQIPAGYRIGLLRTPPPSIVVDGDAIYLGSKHADISIHVDSGDLININKIVNSDITFYRRRQFDQYYTFGEVYRSQYTINQLSQFHQKGYYFFGFEVDTYIPQPSDYDVEKTIFTGIASTYGSFFIKDGSIVEDQPVVQILDFVLVDNSGIVIRSVSLEEVVYSPPDHFVIDSGDDVIIVVESIFPQVHLYTGVQTAENIEADMSFDTGLEYSSSNLYIGETNDGQGNVTRYGWECIARVPYYAIGGVIDSTSAHDIMVHVSYETFGVLEQDS